MTNRDKKFNEHYESITSFKAHDGLILASAFTRYNDKPTLVTGGNDNTVVIWEVRDCAEPNAVSRRNNNGVYTFETLISPTNAWCRSHGGVPEPVRFFSDRIIAAQISR
jgi:WD40 repeat protein